MDNVCQDNVTFDDRNLICMIMMIATNSVVAYGYIRQIMVIHGSDDCTITVMTMMTTTMLFLMRNMEKCGN